MKGVILRQLYRKSIPACELQRKKNDPRFKRFHWTWSGRPDHVVIQFLGDSSLSGPLVHGNSKSESTSRLRNPILPSLARTIETSTEKPAVIYERYKMAVGSNPEHRGLFVPSDKAQGCTFIYKLNMI